MSLLNKKQIITKSASCGPPEIEGVVWNDTIQKWQAILECNGQCVLNQNFALINDAIKARRDAEARLR